MECTKQCQAKQSCHFTVAVTISAAEDLDASALIFTEALSAEVNIKASRSYISAIDLPTVLYVKHIFQIILKIFNPIMLT